MLRVLMHAVFKPASIDKIQFLGRPTIWAVKARSIKLPSVGRQLTSFGLSYLLYVLLMRLHGKYDSLKILYVFCRLHE